MIPLKVVELHASHACNLTCESCAHMSNHGHTGNISAAEAERQLTPWSLRISLRKLTICGGEPTINPELSQIVRVARRLFPDALVQVVTNGFFLHRHPDLAAALEGGQIVVSQHSRSPEYTERFRAACDLLRSWRGVNIKIRSANEFWTRRYAGYGSTMRPLGNGDARAAWKKCPARFAVQLHEGFLWKCPFTAYMPMQAQRFSDLSGPWREMLDYVPLAPSASDEELLAFLLREEERPCGLCPADPPRFMPGDVLVPARELLRAHSR